MRVLVMFMVLFALFSCKKEDSKSNLSQILSFSVKEIDAKFDKDANNNWYAKVGPKTDVTALTAVFEVSPLSYTFIGNTLQTSGFTINDFSKPVTYTVRAEDGSSTNHTVTIYKQAAIAAFSILELKDVEFNITENTMTATVINGTDLKALTAVFETTKGSKLYVNNVEQVSSTTKNDFSAPLTFELKEEGAETVTYTVTITEAQNTAPVANAGEDKTYYVGAGVTIVKANLNASLSSDKEGPLSTFEWKDGDVTIATTQVANVDLNLGLHTITLIVTDAKGLTSSDELFVIVKNVSDFIPVDAEASEVTKNLLKNIGKVALSDQFIFGQEFPLSFKLNGLRYDLITSDCKDVTGSHPGVYGIDPHYMLYKDAKQKQAHIDEAKKAYQDGSVVTFDFHQYSKNDRKIYMKDITTAQDKSLMYDVVNNKNGAREWFYGEMDQVIGIINNDLGFPVVFRLFHEMDGDWFWWGTKATNHSSQLYIEFFRLSVDYIKSKSNLVLFAWSPNAALNTAYYPGDAYVDVVGFDIYEPSRNDLKTKLINLSQFALEHNKVAILAETGYRNDFVTSAPGFWSDVILGAIKDGGNEVRIAWVLSWFNAPWDTQQKSLYIPDINSTQKAKDKFIEFEKDNMTLFHKEVSALEMYK